MANANRRGEVQKILSSLLVSSKEPLTIDRLERDYRELEGERIPWRELGHISVLSFLQSIPRYVRIENRNGTYIALPVVSDKVKHVDSLVSRQRVTKKPIHNRRVFKPSQYFPHVSMPKAFFPAELLKRILCQVNENPRGVFLHKILSNIQMTYPAMNISFSDLTEQLKSMSHQVIVKGNYIYPAERKVQAQYSSCFSNNVASKPDNKPELRGDVTTVKISPAGYEDDDIEGAEEEVLQEESINFKPGGYTSQQQTKYCYNSKKPTSSFIQESILRSQMYQGIDVSGSQSEESERINDIHTDDQAEINQRLTAELNEENGYTNNVEYEDNRAEIDQRLTAELNYTDPQENTNCSKDESIADILNPRTIFRLEKLILNCPNGIWCADLPKKYIEEYGIPLNYNEAGFISVCDFAAHLPNIFHCVKPSETGDYMLFNAKNPIPELQLNKRSARPSTASLYYDMYEEDTDAIPMTLMSDISQKLIPDGAMTFGESVGQVSVTELGGVKGYEEVLIAEVFTPSCFWIQLRKKQSKFEKLMIEIHNFYVTQDKSYVIPPVVLEKGLNCACIYNNEWHRAIIKTVKPNGYVTVLFYDFGTMKTYPPEEIYFLHRSFSYMPAQAIPCGLYNVKPCTGTRWTRGVSCEFLWKTENTPLIALIVNTDVENNSMLVSLVDTQDDEDLHINDWMVQEKLAIYGSMGDTVNLNDRFIEDNATKTPKESKMTALTISTDEHEKEDTVVNSNAQESANMPLISPHSTLNKKPPSIPPGFTVPLKSSNLAQIIDESTRDIFNDGFLNTENAFHNIPTTNTNPFVQPHLMNDTVSSESILEVYKQNLQLHMQITATFNALFSMSSQTETNPFNNLKSDVNETPVQPEQGFNLFSDTSFNSNNHQPAESVITDEMPNGAYNVNNSTNMTNTESNNLFVQSAAADFSEYLKTFTKETFPTSVTETPITSFVKGNPEHPKTNDTFGVNGTREENAYSFKECPQNYTVHSNNADSKFMNFGENVGKTRTENKLFNGFNSVQDNTSARHDYESKLFQSTVTNGASEYFKQTRFDGKNAETFDYHNLKETNPFKRHILENQNFQRAPEARDVNRSEYKTPPPVPNENSDFINNAFRGTKNQSQDNSNVSITTTKIVYEAGPVMYNVGDRKQTSNIADRKFRSIKRTIKKSNNSNSTVIEQEKSKCFQHTTNDNSQFLFQTAKMNNQFASTVPTLQKKMIKTDFKDLQESLTERNNLMNFKTVQSKSGTCHTWPMQQEQNNVNKLHSEDRENEIFINPFDSLSYKMNNCHIADTPSEKFSANPRHNFNPYSATSLQPRIVSPNYRPPPPPYKEMPTKSTLRQPVSQIIVSPSMLDLSKAAVGEFNKDFNIPENSSQIDEGYVTRPSTAHTFSSSPVCTPVQATFKQDFGRDHTVLDFTFNNRTSTNILYPSIFSNVLQALFLKSIENAKTFHSEIFRSNILKRSSSRNIRSKALKASKKHNKTTFHPKSYNSSSSTPSDSNVQHVPVTRDMVPGSMQTIHNIKESNNVVRNAQNEGPAGTVHVTEAADKSSLLLNHEKIIANKSTATDRKKSTLDVQASNVDEAVIQSKWKINLHAESLEARVSISGNNNVRISSESKEIGTVGETVNSEKSVLQSVAETTSNANKDAAESEMKCSQLCNSEDSKNSIERDFNFLTSNNPTDESSRSFLTVELSNRIIYVFHLDDEGWVFTDDFVDAFTNLKLVSVMLRLLDIRKISIPFKILTRSEDPLLFTQLDKSTLNAPRDADHNIKNPIHLTPLKSAIRLLVKLKIISQEEVQRAVADKEFKCESVLYDVMKLIAAYGAYKRKTDTDKVR